jgi:hypothetical protein
MEHFESAYSSLFVSQVQPVDPKLTCYVVQATAAINKKDNESTIIAVDVLSAQLDHVLCIFHAYEQATPSTTVRVSWMRTGFQYEERADTRYLIVNEAAIRSSPGFQEIWQFGSVLDRPSTRRQSQKWGWIN